MSVPRFPVLAVEDDGRVHWLSDQAAFDEIPELFTHGEILYVLDSAGRSYEYDWGDMQFNGVRPRDADDRAAVLSAVADRLSLLSEQAVDGKLEVLRQSGALLDDIRVNADPQVRSAFLLAYHFALA